MSFFSNNQESLYTLNNKSENHKNLFLSYTNISRSERNSSDLSNNSYVT